MHWILQENLFKETEWETLVATLERFDIPYSVHKVIPFIGELVPAPNILATLSKNPNGKVICFGSYSMRHSAQKFGWTPGVYDLEPFDFRKQRAKWGDLMLNDDSQVFSFKNVLWLDGEPRFIRPIHDSKVFAGAVFEWEEFREWQKKICDLGVDYGTSLTRDTLVQVCQPKKIYAEYRFWIVDGQIVTYSLYKRGDRVIYSSDVDKHVLRFADQCVRHGDITLSMRTSAPQPHRAWVLDVCETPDGMRIVETNTINSAGFYAGNVQDLILALEEMEK
jgi:hypothetical protein